MAFFVIHGFDKADALPVRMQHYPEHRAYLDGAEKFGVRIVMSGPLTADDGATPIGSLIIIEAPDRSTAEKFHRADPFYAANIWEKTTVTRFDKKRG